VQPAKNALPSDGNNMDRIVPAIWQSCYAANQLKALSTIVRTAWRMLAGVVAELSGHRKICLGS